MSDLVLHVISKRPKLGKRNLLHSIAYAMQFLMLFLEFKSEHPKRRYDQKRSQIYFWSRRAKENDLRSGRKIYSRRITLNNNAFDNLVENRYLYQNGSMNFSENKQICSKFSALSRGALSFLVSLLVLALGARIYSVTLPWPSWLE